MCLFTNLFNNNCIYCNNFYYIMFTRLLLFGLLCRSVNADVYLHNPRGNNNRCDERSNNRNNANRLFDSQNNAAGGYAVTCNRPEGATTSNDINCYSMKYYAGTVIPIRWTAQHNCGENNECQFILQYACEGDLGTNIRDGHPQNANGNTCTETIPEKTDRQLEEIEGIDPFKYGKNEEFFDDALDVLTKFLESGKTKFIGLSDWSDKKIMQYIDRVSPDVVQPYRNVMDDSYEISGLKNYIDSNNVGVCFFSPIKHGLLTGKYKMPPKFKDGDYRKNVEAFNNQEIIDLLLMNKEKLSDRFSNHSQPVMHGLISPILEDAPTGCVLLGQRNEEQVNKASQLGGVISKEDAEWVKKLYKI